MQPTTTGAPGSLSYELERPRPTGQSARTFFLVAYVRVVWGLVFSAGLTAWLSRIHPVSDLTPMAICSYRWEHGAVCPFGAWIGPDSPVWIHGTNLPVHEQYAVFLSEAVTFPPLTVGLSIATLVTVLLYVRPELHRLPLRGRA